MPDADAFLRAILVAPDDDAPRLVYADWLDERAGTMKCDTCEGTGRAKIKPKPGHMFCYDCRGSSRVPDADADRAEFIRVQCALARYQRAPTGLSDGFAAAEWKRGREDLRDREWKLLTLGNAIAWTPSKKAGWWWPERSIVTRTEDASVTCHDEGEGGWTWTFVRGFVGCVELAGAAWWGSGPCVFCGSTGKWSTKPLVTCHSCHGSGRTSALGPALCAAAPLTEVSLLGIAPSRTIEYPETWFFVEGPTRFLRTDMHHYIPPCVFRLLKKGRVPTYSGANVALYDSREVAMAAVSDAALAWARTATRTGESDERNQADQ